jgi:stage III sporulation protein AD
LFGYGVIDDKRFIFHHTESVFFILRGGLSLDIIKIITVGLATAVACILLRQTKPEIAVVVGICGTVVLLFMVLSGLSNIIGVINSIANKTGIKSEILGSILKIIGIGYLCEIGAGICKDTGSNSVADMVILAGKIMILVVAVPIIQGLVEIVLGILP